jgi:acetyl-CoA synthetase
VAEAAVIPVADEIKGKVPDVYVSLKPGIEPSQEISNKVVAALETMIGKIARPRNVTIVPDMPKTRSGKLMRRVLSAISNRKETGDITTLANPDIVMKIQEMTRNR